MFQTEGTSHVKDEKPERNRIFETMRATQSPWNVMNENGKG